MEVKDLRQMERYSGTYKKLPFEICHNHHKGLPEHNIQDSNFWTYYIYFPSHVLNQEIFQSLSSMLKQEKYGVNYTDSPLMNLEWHCGCTYGEAFYGEEMKIRAIKFGCDYNHYWDQGIIFSIHEVLSDVKNTIDDFYRHFPNALKVEEAL
jgi:hypothetical protein